MILIYTVDAVNRVRNGESIPFRPSLPAIHDMGSEILSLTVQSWDEDEMKRPSFAKIKNTVIKVAGGE